MCWLTRPRNLQKLSVELLPRWASAGLDVPTRERREFLELRKQEPRHTYTKHTILKQYTILSKISIQFFADVYIYSQIWLAIYGHSRISACCKILQTQFRVFAWYQGRNRITVLCLLWAILGCDWRKPNSSCFLAMHRNIPCIAGKIGTGIYCTSMLLL